ncbi:MAG: hypothetical protein IT490_12460 [Candidatus Contendobacter sp.]|nr:hypothetical protein [Candidatus Contendobacter sp.]
MVRVGRATAALLMPATVMVVARSGATFGKQRARGREGIHAASVLSRLAGGSPFNRRTVVECARGWISLKRQQ